jgi:hypothetical protein
VYEAGGEQFFLEGPGVCPERESVFAYIIFEFVVGILADVDRGFRALVRCRDIWGSGRSKKSPSLPSFAADVPMVR